MTRLRSLRELWRGGLRLRRLRHRRGGTLRLASATAVIAVATIVCPYGAVSGQPATGRVTGSVKLTLATSVPSSASAYERRSVGPRPKPQPEIRNVLVFFSDLPATKTAPRHASIAQRDEQFLPHVVAVTVGSTVAFPNDDPFFHNVFSLSRGASFNLGRYPSGASRTRVFTRPGIVKVFCEIHSHMSAVVRVFEHGWFAVPADDGSYAIEDVPPGDHTLVAWHERIGERRERVTIRPGAAASMHFTLPVLEPGQ